MLASGKTMMSGPFLCNIHHFIRMTNNYTVPQATAQWSSVTLGGWKVREEEKGKQSCLFKSSYVKDD